LQLFSRQKTLGSAAAVVYSVRRFESTEGKSNMYSASDLRKGLKIEMDGVPFDIVEYEFYRPGKGQAMYKCRIRNLLNGNVTDKTFREVDAIGEPNLEEREMQYSYNDGEHFVFLENRTYEQITLSPDVLGDQKYFLNEDMTVKVLFHNDRPIVVNLPSYVEKKIVSTEPGARGDTATNVTKAAKIDTGYEIRVPLFINEGDLVRIDTRTGAYSERVTKK
jgi:elongation factor P